VTEQDGRPAEPRAERAPEVGAGEAGPPGRGRIRALIALWLVLILAGPLHFYACGHPADERFAWRMFSAERARSCKGEIYELRGEANAPELTRVRVDREVHRAWIPWIWKGQPTITRRFVAVRCEDPQLLGLRIEQQCFGADGVRHDPVTRDHMCPPSTRLAAHSTGASR